MVEDIEYEEVTENESGNKSGFTPNVFQSLTMISQLLYRADSASMVRDIARLVKAQYDGGILPRGEYDALITSCKNKITQLGEKWSDNDLIF